MKIVTVTWLRISSEESLPSDALSADEELFAANLFFEQDRRRYRRCRALVRRVLATYTNTDARDIQFVYGALGKPSVFARPELQFNVSHSRDVAVIAVSEHVAVGIDVEWIDRDADIEALSQEYFSRSDHDALGDVPNARRAKAFFDRWTRKEALMKGLGYGLSLPPGKSSFTDDLGQAEMANTDRRRPRAAWTVRPLRAPSGFAAALALGEPRVRVRINRSDIEDTAGGD